MQRLVIIAPLAEGNEQKAVDLLAAGPPFEPQDTGFQRHRVYLSEREVIFLFEGPDVEWQVDDLMSDFRRPMVQRAIEAWRPMLANKPRLAREVYSWERSGSTPEARGANSS